MPEATRPRRRPSHNQIDTGDYDVWRAHFGQTAGSGSLTNGTVPEPVTLAMLVVGMHWYDQ